MHYQINVSRPAKTSLGHEYYKHFFATASHSLTDKEAFEDAWKIFKEKFPAPEYNLTASRVYTSGEPVEGYSA